jgi:hypothetical protein
MLDQYSRADYTSWFFSYYYVIGKYVQLTKQIRSRYNIDIE